MELPQLTENLNTIQSLPDKPAVEADELKVLFDLSSNKIKGYMNETLLPRLNTVLTQLQNKDVTLEGAINTMSGIVTQATSDITTIQGNITTIQGTLAGLKNGATTKISKGTNAPSTLANDEIYLQYFN